MRAPCWRVDAFADRPFRGNPAAVCVLPAPAPRAWMQDVAREMNLSETAFLRRVRGGFGLRWFTPVTEEDLCGHATLASAHVLWEEGRLGRSEAAKFFTRGGPLSARRRGDWIELDFPATPPRPARAPPGLLEALGARARLVCRSAFDYLVEVGSEREVRGLRPDFGRLSRVRTRGVIVTSRAGPGGHDFVSRFFAPRDGVDEDPVTGSAHCCLGPFWGERLGKDELEGWQASARGGLVRVRLAGARVMLSGKAVTTMKGELLR